MESERRWADRRWESGRVGGGGGGKLRARLKEEGSATAGCWGNSLVGWLAVVWPPCLASTTCHARHFNFRARYIPAPFLHAWSLITGCPQVCHRLLRLYGMPTFGLFSFSRLVNALVVVHCRCPRWPPSHRCMHSAQHLALHPPLAGSLGGHGMAWHGRLRKCWRSLHGRCAQRGNC